MTFILSACLFVVMLAQGLTLRPADLSVPPHDRGLLWLSLALRYVLTPILALVAGFIFGLDLNGHHATGLTLAAFAVPSVAVLPLVAVGGAALPQAVFLTAIGSAVGLILLPLVLWLTFTPADLGMLFWPWLIYAVIPFAAGLGLRSLGFNGGRWLPIISSAAIGVIYLIALIKGWGPGIWAVMQACLFLAIALVTIALLLGRRLALPDDQTATLTFTTLLPMAALPIGLTTWADPQLWPPMAIWGILAYLGAGLLIILRLRRR
ncbi:hypothetical protein CX676_00410 [Paracoccus zhejiangensis]|uniref:Uncharacterized protein n=2 Tax=Paracoccus zhejiangensis TaxID=1077935 RepID=A0A2H5EU40_9RHOB|nr:hypothetical protein CX676_00410 [Paracoccus zhejiangensis]